MPKHSASRPAFTLIELLVVVAVIAVLISVLLPAIGRAKDLAVRTRCAANQQQCVFSLMVYANDHQTKVITGPTTPSLSLHNYYNSGLPKDDIVAQAKGYIKDWRIWACPAVGMIAIDNIKNTRTLRYCDFQYFPGTTGPFMGTAGKTPAPLKLDASGAASDHVMMQDKCLDWTGLVAGYNFYTNHAPTAGWYAGTGGFSDGLGANPSLNGRTAKSRGQIDGLNETFYDGHVRWVREVELSRTGTDNGPAGTLGYVMGLLNP